MKFLSLLCVFALSACAGLVSGNKQTVTVVTPGVEGASCSLTDSKGKIYYVSSTPGSVLVKKGGAPLSVICKKDAYESGTGEIHDKFAPASWGNLALLPLAPVGYFLDSMSGSMMNYDSKIEIEMDKSSSYSDSSSLVDE